LIGTGLSLERRIQIGFGIAVAIIAGVGAAALRSTEATVNSAHWVAHTLQVRAELAGTVADLIEAETGVRGYVITGDTSYLAPYHAAEATLNGRVAGLRALTADNPAQQRRVDSLEALVATRLERFRWTIDTRRAGGPAAGARAVIGGRGKELLQLVHQVVTRMEDDETQLLAQRSAALQARARLARLAAWTGMLVAIALAGVASALVGREMARRRRAEQTLGDTQTRFQQMLASSTAVIYANAVSGSTFSPTWVSENVTRITGYAAGEPLEPTWWLDNLHPDDRARVLAELPALFANDQLTTEYRFRGKDGAYHWVHDESRLLRDAAGQPTEVVGSWVDITDRREAEASLRTSEQRLRLLVGSVRDYAIYMLDPEGHVQSWNAGAQHIKGYTEAEILGQHFSRFYVPEDVAAGKPAAALRAAATDGRFEAENWRVRKDGTRFWADVVITAVRDQRGVLVGFAKVTRDLTERKRAEQALRASEERFRILAVTANDAILSADSHGNITYFNPGAERIFGFTAEEVSGRPLTTLMPERFQDAHRAGLARYLATGEPRVIGRTVELAGRRKDGTEFPLELSLAAWKQGAEIAFTAIIRDITSRKEGEDRLRSYAAQLEAANKELEAFSYSVSHDLRAPLRSLDGFSQALLEDYHARLDDTGRDFLQRVRAASQRMGRLIDDLLGLSRVTRGQLQVAEVDLSALAAAVAADLAKSDPERDVRFAIAPDLVARADGGLVRIVLQNLLGNAWKFTGKRSPAHVEVGVTAHNGRRAFFVRDDGAGFDMTYAAKLFGAFQRLHASDEFPGSGIGLATVQRIIHRHGGEVWAEGTPGRGATFYFTL
jgi:PAS domain S-box-containing protein